jgi:hypothetical protein
LAEVLLARSCASGANVDQALTATRGGSLFHIAHPAERTQL